MGPETREPTTAEKERREGLLREYGEVCSTFRTLTDIRFRLLGLLPVAAAAAAAFKPEGAPPGRIPFALFGLAVTLALVTYNHRNDQFYDELIGRAGAIERELGIPDGAFASRPGTWLFFQFRAWTWTINHGNAVGLIYLASVSFWFYMVLEGIAASLARTPWAWYLLDFLPKALVPHVGTIGRFFILILAVACTLGVGRRLKTQMETKEKVLRSAIAEAGAMLAEAERVLHRQRNWSSREIPQPPIPASHVLAYFATPDVTNPVAADERASDQDRARFLKLCAQATGETSLASSEQQINRYAAMDETALLRLIRGVSGRTRNSHLLALLVRQPPRWVQDVIASYKDADPVKEAGKSGRFLIIGIGVVICIGLIWAGLRLWSCVS